MAAYGPAVTGGQRWLAGTAWTAVESIVLGFVMFQGIVGSLISGSSDWAWYATGFAAFWVLLISVVAIQDRAWWLLAAQALPAALVAFAMAAIIDKPWTGQGARIPW